MQSATSHETELVPWLHRILPLTRKWSGSATGARAEVDPRVSAVLSRVDKELRGQGPPRADKVRRAGCRFSVLLPRRFWRSFERFSECLIIGDFWEVFLGK